ncbi:hypothetical protein NUQ34_01790 [Glaesserella parasuis]|nr:hypothetical protein [Glaesserella parasuis]MDE3932722.1 hypothetical protein [Glaesserella parasuis]MDE3945944.1 hypothetical protein [Glaesserella parasuis]MDP0379513.1 hypothetical protein [Glaesserella parasuis]MDP0402088.1 hypothetical protein [Glaesserella parasuis]
MAELWYWYEISVLSRFFAKNQAKVAACISFACEISLFGLLSRKNIAV